MTSIDEQALTMLIQMVQKSILLVNSDYTIQNLNSAAEQQLALAKNKVIGTSLKELCTQEELDQLTTTGLVTINLKSKHQLCYAIIVQDARKTNPISNLNDRQYLDIIISQIPVSVYWMNKDYIYQGCSNNMAKLLNLGSRQEIVGKTYKDLYDQKSTDSYIKSDRKVIEQGLSVNLEEPLYQPDGSKLVYLSKKVPLRDERGHVIGMLGISTEITERKKMEDELKLAKDAAEAGDRAKTEFLANMRHDIRTPLSGIVGFSEILKTESKELHTKEYADNLIASSYALLDLMDEVLEAVRVSSGEIPKLKRKFDFNSLLAKVIDLHKAKASEKKVLLNAIIDKKLPRFVIGDKIRIQRIISELIGNALNFTQKGHVTLTVELAKIQKRDLIVRIKVSDSGIGIAKDKQQDIYLQFKRLIPSYEGLYKGTGLGLYVVKQFIDELNGEIYVKSKIGEGTSFTCLIPLQESLLDDSDGIDEEESDFEGKPYLITPSPQISHHPNLAKRNKVLVVEDNPIAQKVARTLLNSMDCHVELASSGQEAIEKIKQNHYDLIFMDIGLGAGADGYEVTRQIRKQETDNEHTPIVALTAHAAEENKQSCIEAGMDAVLSKPITKTHASNILNHFIRNPEGVKREKIEQAKLDLPDTEAELFALKQFPLLEVEQTLKNLGNKSVFIELLQDLINVSIPQDLPRMKDAFAAKDYEQVEKLAHKMKGGAVYVGTIRMKYACQYLERYWKSGQRELFEKLYEQAVSVLEETVTFIEHWLTLHYESL
ncbi:response regulator [Legionella drozanskii]|uniref:histidine kinase n=1 Tax=Legionella drozanskii LLAP-1 TaxID=1212489 RepID=A0A0W0SV39_9GAMM|nr:response regulator [Legionella drozanskii]KTC87246.1 sensory histidine-kinase / response regulator [Legionella drozanskii LLAP-1]